MAVTIDMVLGRSVSDSDIPNGNTHASIFIPLDLCPINFVNILLQVTSNGFSHVSMVVNQLRRYSFRKANINA